MPAYADSIIHADPQRKSSNQSNAKGEFETKYAEEDVVVSGMSGRFPESSSVREFSKNLYEGVDMVTDDDRRWLPGLFGLPKRSGKLPDLSHFDASFFSVSPRQAHCMDPQLRLLLEVSHEAIFDAGLHPNALKGKCVGVYVGVSGSETEEFITGDPDRITGYELTGCCRAMFANRLSYALDLKGPSFAVDTACSSALVAFQTAWSAVSEGRIDAAIVAGSNLTLKPQSSLQFHSLNMLSEDGSCKAFDARANGYVRSEAVTAILLQRRRDAVRVYSHVVQARTNTDGFKGEGITFPSGEVQKSLLQEVYEKASVDPSSVSYVEAHGTGTKAGDPQELNAIADIFCKNRSEPLMIGSVKSNMGHSEPASGLCALIKVLLAMQNREIPGNLHFQSPNPDIKPLNDGRLKVVNENTPWRGSYAAINCFGFGGANVHVLLRTPEVFPSPSTPSPSDSDGSFLRSVSTDSLSSSSSQKRDNIIPEGGLPRLVLTMGRTEENVREILEEFRRNRNVDFAALLDNINYSDASVVSFPQRGYTIVGGGTESQIINVTECPSERKPLWLIFSGMGSQWRGCGRVLLELPPFDHVIQRCRSALLPLGIDVLDIITREEPNPMSSTTNSFTAIAAVQVGLVEVLKSVGLTDFDGFIGHSVGELGCGYADGALTPEQTVLAAYWRGRAVEEAGLPLGAMAAVGLSAEDTEKFLRKDSGVVVACRNSASSVTISGPKDEVALVKERLDAEGIFCRNVDSGGISFHHTSLRKAAPRLLAELQKVILTPVRRSSRWISSSVPESKWSSGIAQKASPEYLVNNLVSPVLFAEALTKIPEGAKVIEVSPHALMQAVLRRALPSCSMIPLVRKESKDVLCHLLESLGKLYVLGERINLTSLYFPPKFPVPVNTPSIGSLIKWDHSVEWDVAKFESSSNSEFKLEVDLNDASLSFLEGHTIDGRVLFPATGYMTLAWRALAKLVNKKWEDLPVTFCDVVLHQATVLSTSTSTCFIVRLLLKKGEFEVLAGDTVAASGKIFIGVKESSERNALQEYLTKESKEISSFELSYNEVYKELSLRGYQYSGDFRGIKKSDINGTKGELIWKKNWISLLDTLLQFSLLGSPSKGLYLPTRIRKVHVEPSKLYKMIEDKEEQSFIQVSHNRKLGVTVCPGVEIYGLKATMAPRKAPTDNPTLEGYQFYPNVLPMSHKLSENLTLENATNILLDLILENSTSLKIKIAHILGDVERIDRSTHLSRNVMKRFDVYPLLAVEYNLSSTVPLTKDQAEEMKSSGVDIVDDIGGSAVDKLNLLIVSNPKLEQDDYGMVAGMNDHSFILVDDSNLRNEMVSVGLVEIASIEKFDLHLLRKPTMKKNFEAMDIDGEDMSFSWVEVLKEKMLDDSKQEESLWLISRGFPTDGLLGMVKCLNKEPGGQRLRCIMDPEKEVEANSPQWQKILANNLVYNVVHSSSLGTMRHLPLPPPEKALSGYSYLNVLTRGDLSSLTWLSAPVPSDLPEGGDTTLGCSVSYAPLNFRDIMLASGKLPPDALPGSVAQRECILGLEFAGISGEGKRVMGLMTAGGLATWVQADPYLVWEVPEGWSLKEAATVPVVYATAYYALVVRGCLQPGESVLIHAGSGGVGQAAISIALSRGCTVYTTVSSEKKRNFLKERFPQLTDRNFANSRDSSFEYHILEETEGKGVDLVLNSLAGDLLQASVRCLKEHGRFLEIGKADLANNTGLGMAIFLKNISFHGILLDALFEGSVARKQLLQEVLYDGIASGEVKPLPSTVYTSSEIEEAFRFMASGKHIGKVLLEITPEGERSGSASRNKSKKKGGKTAEHQTINVSCGSEVPSVYRFWPKPAMVYVITGGLGGLGLELADWLLSRGARNLVLTSRRGISTGYQALCVKRWKASGANVRILQQDASTYEGAEALLTESSKEGPVGGIFHLAVVLEDSILENQSSEKFSRVSRVKADGARYLDMVSRKLCPELHVWITFSSVACGKGNAGQSNYGWANSVSERVVENRVADGLPGCAIQWGGIADVGVLADTLGNVEVAGTKPQSLRSVLSCLDDLIGSRIPVVCSVCLSTKKSSSKSGKGSKSLVASMANILGIRDISKAPMNVSLGDLGMDSLMAVEIKQTLEREADVVLSTEQIRELKISQIQEIESQHGTECAEKSQKNSEPNGKSSENEAFSWLNFPLVSTEVIRCLSNETGSNSPPLFIAAPIQGTCDVLLELSSEIQTKVIGLEYTPDLPTTEITKLAAVLVQKIENYLPEGPFYLGGYSYGASVAYEVASQLQAKGRTPLSLVLLDGSHSYVSGIIGTYRNKYNNVSRKRNSTSPAKGTNQESDVVSQGESDALVTYALQFCSVDALKLRNSLVQLNSFSDRLDFIADTITKHVQSSHAIKGSNLTRQEIKISASLFFDRLIASFKRDPSTVESISVKTLLVRASQNTHLQNLGSDYGLSKVINKELQVRECPGTHESFILSQRAKIVAKHINEFLNTTKCG